MSTSFSEQWEKMSAKKFSFAQVTPPIRRAAVGAPTPSLGGAMSSVRIGIVTIPGR
jgi:hypothetical protein